MVRLRRTSPEQPGWTRKRSGRGFVYLDELGERLGPEEVARVRALVIPPAWEDVWITPHPNGHLQAVGTDAAGRRQYLYHPDWRTRRDAEKFDRVLEFGRALGQARAHVLEDLRREGMPRERACAVAVRLLDLGYFRIGNDVYADMHGSFGLTTLQRRHVRRMQDRLVFTFTGKSGVDHRIEIDDAMVREALDVMRRRRGGQELLAYLEARRWRAMLPQLVNDYVREVTGVDATAKTWVLTAYLLSASIFTPIMGRLGDMIGKERVFVATLVALTAGSVMAALSHSIGLMIVARVVQGVGGGVLPLAFGIIRDEFPKEKVTGAVGAIASLSAVGAGLGIVLAGPIVNALDWHWLFWIPMILTAAAALAAVIFVPESPVRTPGRISWLPAVLLSGWLVALLVPLSEASDWGWGSARVVGLLVAAVVLASAWVFSELRAVTPLIDMKMMRLTAVWTNNLVALLIGVGMYATFAFLPEFVQTPKVAGYGFGASITQSGLMLLPSSITMFVVAMFAGRMAQRVGGKALVVAGCAIGVISMAMLAFAHSQQWEIYVSTAVMGVGFGLAFSAMSGLIVAAVPAEQTGVASGMNANIRTIGGSIGSAVMASIVTSHVAASGMPKESGYSTGFAILGGGLVLAALAGLLIPQLRTRPSHDDTDAPHAELGMVAGGTLVGDTSE